MPGHIEDRDTVIGVIAYALKQVGQHRLDRFMRDRADRDQLASLIAGDIVDHIALSNFNVTRGEPLTMARADQFPPGTATTVEEARADRPLDRWTRR